VSSPKVKGGAHQIRVGKGAKRELERIIHETGDPQRKGHELGEEAGKEEGARDERMYSCHRDESPTGKGGLEGTAEHVTRQLRGKEKKGPGRNNSQKRRKWE